MSKGTGGMQTSGLAPSLCCPVCGKPAFRAESADGEMRYCHFTKTGCMWHTVEEQK